jgi:glycosyltransferase involved in cell wall biosynthesis
VRVLLVLSQPPLPEGSAAGRCAVATIQGLRAMGHDLTVLAGDLTGRGDEVPPELAVEVVAIEQESAGRERLERWTRPRSYLGRDPFASRALELAREADVVQLEEVDAGVARVDWPVPAVAHLHFLTLRDRSLLPPWHHEARVGLELWRAERVAVRRRDHLLANSEEVAAGLRRAGARDVAVAPLGLDPEPYARQAALTDPVAGLIGTAGWPPTASAVRELLGGVWPAVHAQEPGAELRLAGRGMTAATFAAPDDVPGVRWLGEVQSADAFLRELGVLLYPLARGSGTKVKVLEALALGVPVVTTREGAEGVAPNDGVLVAEDDDTLVAHAVRLLRDPDERVARGRAARAAYEAGHAPEVVGRRLTAIYERILRDRGGRAVDRGAA